MDNNFKQDMESILRALWEHEKLTHHGDRKSYACGFAMALAYRTVHRWLRERHPQHRLGLSCCEVSVFDEAGKNHWALDTNHLFAWLIDGELYNLHGPTSQALQEEAARQDTYYIMEPKAHTCGFRWVKRTQALELVREMRPHNRWRTVPIDKCLRNHFALLEAQHIDECTAGAEHSGIRVSRL